MSQELIRGCRLIDLEVKGDERGSLVSLEELRSVPFEFRRAYYIFGTKAGVSRGFHAHRRLHQLAVCVAGSCSVLLDNNVERINVALDKPNKGLLIGPMVWHEMHDFSADCVMLVLADDFYDEAEYIRSIHEFRHLTGNG